MTVYRRLTSADGCMYNRAMEMYRGSFPMHEQRESDSQRRIMGDGDYHFELICAGEALLGCILYWETLDFIYVEHFFIAPEQRGKGCGRQALEWLKAQGRPVILEIDPITDEISRRRKNFYERAGFAENPFKHVHPPYHSGMEGHPLTVMSCPEPLSGDLYQKFSRYLRQRVMGQDKDCSPSSPRL